MVSTVGSSVSQNTMTAKMMALSELFNQRVPVLQLLRFWVWCSDNYLATTFSLALLIENTASRNVFYQLLSSGQTKEDFVSLSR